MDDLRQWEDDLRAARRLQMLFPSSSIRNIVQQIESIVRNKNKMKEQ
jgi:hypothetical protein